MEYSVYKGRDIPVLRIIRKCITIIPTNTAGSTQMCMAKKNPKVSPLIVCPLLIKTTIISPRSGTADGISVPTFAPQYESCVQGNRYPVKAIIVVAIKSTEPLIQ